MTNRFKETLKNILIIFCYLALIVAGTAFLIMLVVFLLQESLR